MNKGCTNIVGQRFGKLVVIRELDRRLMPDGKTWRRQYECLCDCGRVCVHTRPQLVSNYARSCGCLFTKYWNKGTTTNSRLYHIWRDMKSRTKSPCYRDHKVYGHVTLCSEWEDFDAFREWALDNGYSEDLSIDRIDNSKGYSPDNCRWSNNQTQTLNRSQTKLIDGIPAKIVYEKAPIKTVSYPHFLERYFKLGWDLKDALERPKITHKYDGRIYE